MKAVSIVGSGEILDEIAFVRKWNHTQKTR